MTEKPTEYALEIVVEFCRRMAEDTRSTRSVSRDDDMPERTRFLRWLEDSFDEEGEKVEDHSDARTIYAHAQRLLVHGWIEETIEIADDATNDFMVHKNKKGEEVYGLDDEHVRRSDIRIKTRQWIAERMLPKFYGNATTLKHADADGENLPAAPAAVQIVVVAAEPREARQLAPMRNVTPGVEEGR